MVTDHEVEWGHPRIVTRMNEGVRGVYVRVDRLNEVKEGCVHGWRVLLDHHCIARRIIVCSLRSSCARWPG